MQWNGVRRVIWPKHFDEMEIIGTMHFSVAVPIEADPEFKAMILAAGVTHSDGNHSIDYTYNRYKDDFIERFDPDKTCPEGSVKECLLNIRNNAVEIAETLSKLETLNKSNVGLSVAANTLIRLQATFHASIQLALTGLGIEADAVTRQGLEQIAWSLHISGMDDFDAIQKIKPNHCITSMKQHIRGSGLIYGMLSNSAHIAPRTHDRFISLVDGEIKISIRNPNNSAISAFYILLLLDAYNLAVSNIFATAGFEFKGKLGTTKILFNGCKEFANSEFKNLLKQWRENDS